jgi:hypothetical protein
MECIEMKLITIPKNDVAVVTSLRPGLVFHLVYVVGKLHSKNITKGQEIKSRIQPGQSVPQGRIH